MPRFLFPFIYYKVFIRINRLVHTVLFRLLVQKLNLVSDSPRCYKERLFALLVPTRRRQNSTVFWDAAACVLYRCLGETLCYNSDGADRGSALLRHFSKFISDCTPSNIRTVSFKYAFILCRIYGSCRVPGIERRFFRPTA